MTHKPVYGIQMGDNLSHLLIHTSIINPGPMGTIYFIANVHSGIFIITCSGNIKELLWGT